MKTLEHSIKIVHEIDFEIDQSTLFPTDLNPF